MLTEDKYDASGIVRTASTGASWAAESRKSSKRSSIHRFSAHVFTCIFLCFLASSLGGGLAHSGVAEDLQQAKASIEGGDCESAIPHLSRIADRQEINYLPELAEFALLNRAMCLNATGGFVQSVKDLDRLIEIKSDNPWSFYYRGVAKFELREYTDAIRDFTNSIELKADFFEPYLYRGIALNQMNQLGSAIEDLTFVVSLNENHYVALINLSAVLYKTGNIELAMKRSKDAIQVSPEKGDAYFIYGKILEKLGDDQKASANLSKASEFGFAPKLRTIFP